MGTCLRPSWMATVWPTMSGKIVEARAQVRITFLSRAAFILVIFSCRFLSMYGPFFSERLNLFLLPAADDQAVGSFLRLPRAVAERRLAPGRLRVPAGARLALATAMRVVGGIHRRAAHRGPLAQPARAAGLASRLVLVLQVADLAERRAAGDVDAPELARGHPDRGVVALFREQLRGGPGRADQLAAPTQRQLQVVDGRTDRDARQRQAVARAHRRVRSAHELVADLHTERGQDVALLAVLVVEEGDPGAPVGVVLDRRHPGRDAVLVPLEVDPAVEPPVAAAVVADGDPALVVASGRGRHRLDQTLLGLVAGDLLEG